MCQSIILRRLASMSLTAFILTGWLAGTVTSVKGDEFSLDLEKVAKLNHLEIVKAIRNQEIARRYVESRMDKPGLASKKAGATLLFILGDKSQDYTVRRAFRDGNREERLLAALALRWNGDDSVIPHVLGLWGALYEQGMKHHEAETVPPDSDLMAMFFCIQVLSKLEQEKYWDVVFPYLSHPDPDTRKGAIGLVASHTRFSSFDPREKVNQGYDYREGAEANQGAIGRLKEWVETKREKWESSRDSRWAQLWGVKRDDPAELRKRKEKELRARLDAAQTAEEKKQAALEFEAFMKEVHGEEVWVDYPGRGPRPAPSHEERLKRVGILGYSTKVSRLYREAREIGDKELSLEFNRKDIEFATRADQRVGPQIKEGMEYVEHIRDALGRMPRFLQPRTLNHYADQLVLIDGMLNAKDYEEWEWYQAQDRRLWANMELDPKVTSAADERTAEFQRRLAEQSPPVLDYAVWSRKLLARAGESVQMSKQLEERIGEVGERAYYFKLHWRHMAAKKAGDQATVEEMYQAKIRYLLGEYGPPEIEEGLQFFLELRKAIQDEPVPMPQEQADHYVNLFVRLNGLMSAENVQDADLYRRECRRWMQGAEHRIDEKVKALVAEKKKEYEQKLKTMK